MNWSFLTRLIAVIFLVTTFIVVAAVRMATADEDITILKNGDFESVQDAKVGPDGLVAGWRLGTPAQIPTAWQLNSVLHGQLTIDIDNPHAGLRFVRLTAAPSGTAQLIQMCQGLQAGQWYRVSLWARGGEFSVQTYEYSKQKQIGGQVLLQQSADNQWQRFSAFYQPGGEGYWRSALALSTHNGDTIDIDDVTIEPVAFPKSLAKTPILLFQNDAVQVSLSALGLLTHLVDRASGKDYAAINPARPVFIAQRAGARVPVTLLTRKGDVLTAQFIDPDVKVSLRVVPGKRHFSLEVLSVEPADIDALYIEFPLQRLQTVGPAFNATYDQEFGASFFGATANTLCSPVTVSNAIQSLRCESHRNHGIAGAKFSLVATPFADFKSAIMEAECASGLPCPKPGAPWGRDSASVRKSYLFATDASEANIDTLIAYAKLGGFGTILFLKENWLKTHGHYQINTDNFPHGLDGVKAAVAKIHAAGLEAGVHVFGPSISPNDAYITPKPDARLATAPVPPLAEALDEKTTTLTLSAAPKLPPNGPSSKAFPGAYLRVGDEIIAYGQAEPGTPFRYRDCVRGALGTQAAVHPVGSTVQGLLALWGFFLVDPDSTLADELTQNFADVINQADFDMVYFDADGPIDAYIDRWYYHNRMHLGYYQKFKKDVLYQTSSGSERSLVWHISPRSASADGHGDIKGYLDQRWPYILGLVANFICPDIGWYYWFKEGVRPDQLEYVAAKAMGVDGSISLETSQVALESQVQSRQMMDMLHQWEQCRRADPFSPVVKAKLREPRKEFKLFGDAASGWQLYRAVYEAPKVVEVLDGQSNTWTLRNDAKTDVELGVEIVSSGKPVAPDGAQAPQPLPPTPLGQPIITVNGQAVIFPVSMAGSQALTSEGPGGVMLWPGGMAPGQKVAVSTAPLRLKPGENTVTFSTTTPDAFPGAVRVLLYRVWPMEKD